MWGKILGQRRAKSGGFASPSLTLSPTQSRTHRPSSVKQRLRLPAQECEQARSSISVCCRCLLKLMAEDAKPGKASPHLPHESFPELLFGTVEVYKYNKGLFESCVNDLGSEISVLKFLWLVRVCCSMYALATSSHLILPITVSNPTLARKMTTDK